MIKTIKQNRQAQFLLIGTCLMVLGSILKVSWPNVGQLLLYFAILFLGYFATVKAIGASVRTRTFNVDLLMILAALGAIIIGQAMEAVTLLFIFSTAEVLENYAEGKSSSAISALMAQVPDEAQLVQADGSLLTVLSQNLKLNDIILVTKGAQFPIDGIALQATTVSEVALTGEALPLEKEIGATVYAGTVNLGRPVQVKVTVTSQQTVFSNIVRLVDQAQKRPSKLAQAIERFESRYVTVVLLTVPIFIISLMLFQGMPLREAFYRGMVLLTVASPCALVAAVTPATLSAMSHAARLGVLVKGGKVIENFGHLRYLFSDKTGTLTQGTFTVLHLDLSERYWARVLTMEASSQHPIAQAIVTYFEERGVKTLPSSPQIEELAGQGLVMGDLKLGRPAAFVNYEDPCHYLANNEVIGTHVLIAEGKTLVGEIILADQLRPEAIAAIHDFQQQGISVTMLTGDNARVAAQIATEAGIEHYRADCLPEDKLTLLKEVVDQGVVAMIGDGINDAPALAQADIGIAMGSGTAVAMETADIVMVKNNLARLFQVFQLSRRLQVIIWQNLIFSIGVIALLVLLNLFGVLDLTRGVIFHEGSTLLVILNGLRLLGKVKN